MTVAAAWRTLCLSHADVLQEASTGRMWLSPCPRPPQNWHHSPDAAVMLEAILDQEHGVPPAEVDLATATSECLARQRHKATLNPQNGTFFWRRNHHLVAS